MLIRLLLCLLLLPSLAHATVDWDEGFEYATNAAMDLVWGSSCPGNDVILFPSTERAHSGAKSLKEIFRGHQGITPGYQSCWKDRNLNAPTTSTLYSRFWFYLPSSFVLDATVTKMTLHPAYAGDSYTSMWWTMLWGNPQLEVGVQKSWSPPSLGDQTENIYGGTIPRDQWVCIETRLTYATPGQQNGIVQAWIDGVQNINRSNVWMDQTGQQSVFRAVRLYVQDGVGNIYYDDYAVSRDARIGCGSTPPPPTDTTSPSAPSNLATSVSGTNITLTWTVGSDAGGSGLAGTDLLSCTGVSCTPTASLTTTNGTTASYIASGLTQSTVYGFAARSRDGAGNLSSTTSPVYATTGGTFLITDAAIDFTGANNPTGMGSSWTAGYNNGAPTNNFQILSNRAMSIDTVVDSIATYNTAPANDQFITIAVPSWTTATSYPGVLVRAANSPTLTAYECRVVAPGNNARIAEWTAGSWAQLIATTAYTFQAGDSIRCEAEGTALRMYRIRSAVETLILSTNDATIASGKAGLISFEGSNVLNTQIGSVVIGHFSATPPTPPTIASIAFDATGFTSTTTGTIGSYRLSYGTDTGAPTNTILQAADIVAGRYNIVFPDGTSFACLFARDAAGVENSVSDAYRCGVPVIGNVDHGPNTGVLRVHGTNPRWLTNDSGKALLFSGPSGGDATGSAARGFAYLQDFAAANAPMVNDPAAAVASMTAEGLNFMRLWVDIASAWGSNAEFAAGTYWTTPTDQKPWKRVGTRVDTSTGGSVTVGIYDLAQFNQAFFDRVRARVLLASNAGITTSIMLVSAYPHFDYVDHGGFSTPFLAANNVNGVSCDGNANGRCEELFATTNAAMLAVMAAYADKLVDTLNDIDSVIWEPANECKADCSTWLHYMADRIEARELTGGRQSHPIWMTPWTDATNNTWLYNNTHAQIISPLNVVGEDFESAPPANAGSATVSVWFYDTDHWGNLDGQVGTDWAWKSFLRGVNPILLDCEWCARESLATRTAIKLRMAQALNYAARVDLAAMTVETGTSVIATGYGLYAACSEYLMYQPTAATNAINLTACAGQSFTTEYLNPATGAITTAADTAGGASRNFVASAERVVYLKLNPVAVDVTPPTIFGCTVDGQPSNGTPLLIGTTSATIQCFTDEAATLKYGGTAGIAYGSIPYTFSSTGGTTHTTSTATLTNGGEYTTYLRAQDASLNASASDTTVVWRVAGQPDMTAPTLSNGTPTAILPAGTTSTTMAATANEPAVCYWSLTDQSYALMAAAGSAYAMSGATLTKSSTVSGLTNGSTTPVYGRCADTAVPTPNVMTSSYVWSIVVDSSTADTTAPSMVAGLSATLVGAQQADLTWAAATDAGGVAGYWLYTCLLSNCSDKVLVQQLGNTSTTVYGLPYGATIYFAVEAIDTSSNRSAALSNIASVTTTAIPDVTPPSTMTNLRVLATYTSSALFTSDLGTDDRGAVTTTLELSPAGCASYVFVYSNLSLNALTTNLAPNTTYCVRGKFSDGINLSAAYSNEVVFTTAATGITLPRAPVSFSQPRTPRVP